MIVRSFFFKKKKTGIIELSLVTNYHSTLPVDRDTRSLYKHVLINLSTTKFFFCESIALTSHHQKIIIVNPGSNNL